MHDPVFVPSSAHTGIDMNAALLACLPGIRLLINSLKEKRGFSKQHDFVSHPRQVDSRNTAASKEKSTPPSSIVHETHMQTRVKSQPRFRYTPTSQTPPFLSSRLEGGGAAERC